MKRNNRIQAALRRGMARTFVLGPVVFLLVAGAGCPSLFESSTQRATRIKQAVVGKDGAYTVPAPNTVVNRYAQLAGAADPVAGDKTITVTDVNANFLSAVSQGDLLLIVQMAGATIDTSESVNYGAVTDLGSAGRYEFVGVEGISGNDIALACGLRNGYSRTGKTQVIRVPQYTTLTVGSANSITALAWDGVTGGVVAVHAETTLQLDGSVDVSAKGFRGGAAPAAKTSAAAGSAIAIYSSTAETDGAEKGEGIAGYPPDFTTGRYGRGAPANGGGGGDSHNAGGGGGANAGDPAAWTSGLGVMLADPDVVGGTLAWPREVTTLANSQGGGRGGYSYSANGGGALDPTTATGAPNLTTWGGDDRRVVGGLGGHPVPNSPVARLFIGGGGGAGDGNNGVAGPGGRGGGLIFIIAGAVAGSGALHADGAAGGSSTGTAGTAGDAAGGGGGGGAVILSAGSVPATIVVTANGGVGGDHTNGINANEVEGPGGGGGGGYIAVSGGTLSAAGALGGTTTVATSAMANFRTNGATAGHAGLTTGSASTFLYCGVSPLTTIATHPANPSKTSTGDFTFTNTLSPVTYECKIDTGAWGACTASYTTPTLADGSHTLSVRATDSNSNVEVPPVTFTWSIDTVAPDTTIATNPTDPSNTPTGTFTFTSNETPVTFACKLDTGDWAACTASYTTPTLTDGAHTLSVRATDAAGNTDASPATYTWAISTTAPVTTIATFPPNPSKTATGDFTFTNTLSPVSYECKLDTGAWTACDASYTTPTLVDGSHTLSVRASETITDAGVIVEDPPVTYTWTIDTVAPDTTIATKPSDPSSGETGDFTFTSSETPATFACKLDTGDWTPCTASYTTPPLANGPHTLGVRATDAAGNTDATPATYTWMVEGSSVDGGVVDAGQTDASAVALDGALVVTVDAEELDAEKIDVQGPDLALVVRDAPQASDAVKLDNASTDLLADVQQAGPEPGPDTAPPAPEPKPDAAVVVKEDAALPPANKDAAPATEDFKIMGSGFCAIASSRSSTPAPFMVLGLAALALLLRRRKRSSR